MTALDQLADAAEIGEKAREFMESDLGVKMLELADKEVEAALLALADVSPAETGKIMELQMRARFGRTFGTWLENLVFEGNQAIAVFKQQQET